LPAVQDNPDEFSKSCQKICIGWFWGMNMRLGLSMGLAVSVLLSVQTTWALPFDIAGVQFDSDNSTTTAEITGGGYNTPFGIGLHSDTSPDWTVTPSLGTYFQMPTFQKGYDPTQATNGVPGTAVTLGQDPGFPETSLNERDIIELTWGAGNGLANGTGDDLVVFEAATSEAFAIRVHSVGTGSGTYWSPWFYTPYTSNSDPSALDNDATPSLFDLTQMGLAGGEVINALEITNLLIDDTLGAEITALGIHAEVFFGGSSNPGEDNPLLRFSTGQQDFVSFAAHKFDPDIQYVAALHDLSTGVPAGTSLLDTSLGLSAPARLVATGPTAAPVAGVLPLLGLALPLLLGCLRRYRHSILRRY
jgi:hypothetical protein